MERGQLGSLAYQMTFPQQQGSVESPIAAQSTEAGNYLPSQKDPLAVRRKLTSDYYNSYATMQNIVKDALSQGIDPFKPDYSQEGGGLAHQMFTEAQANLMYAANALSNEFKAEQQTRPYELQGQARLKPNVQREGMYYSDPNNFYSTALDPIVTQANQELGDSRYTQGDSNRVNQAIRDPKIQYYQQQIQRDPNNAEYYQRQIEGLLKNTPQTAYQQLIPRGGRGGGSPEIEVLKKVTNLAQGVWPEGTYSLTTKGGKALLENKTFAGEYLGDYHGVDAKGNPKVYRKIVKRWVKDPNTGDVTVEFDNSEIPSENVSNTKGDVVASALITNNPKYGSASKMYETARELGYLDDTSSAINEALIPKEAEAMKDSARTKAMAESESISAKYSETKKNLEELENPILGNNWKIFTLPDGREIEIAKHKNKGGKKYYIRNWEDLGFDKEVEDLTIDQALQYLDDFNYFDRFLGQSNTPKVINKGGKKAY